MRKHGDGIRFLGMGKVLYGLAAGAVCERAAARAREGVAGAVDGAALDDLEDWVFREAFLALAVAADMSWPHVQGWLMRMREEEWRVKHP